MSEERPSPSLARNPSNLSSRSQSRPSALQRQRSGGEHRVRINAESPGGKNKRQRQSPDDNEKFAELEEEDERSDVRHTKKDSQSGGNTKAELKRSNTSTSASTPTPAPNAASTSASSTKFSRTKPPAKSHASLPLNPSKPTTTAPKDNRPQHQSAPESTGQNLFSPSATETAEEPPQVVSASFESRMKNVRAWIKGRNPSMISPTLTATSEATATQHSQLKRRSSSFLRDEKPRTGKSSGGGGGLDDLPKLTKRKAARQLAPSTNTKRWAAEDEQERPSQWTVVEEDRIPQQSSSSSRRRRSGDQATLDSVVPTTDRNREARDYSFSQPAPVVRQNSTTRTSDDRNRPSSLPTNIDWDRFQKMIGATGSRRPSSSSAANTRQRYTGKSSIATLLDRQHHHDEGPQDDSPTLAPLIKLRQSQLKQHQQEDFFGVKRKEAGERRTKFDSTLDLWEHEDDETLARNAAREAEDVEARSQLLSQSRRDASSEEDDELGSPPKDERELFTFTSPSRASKTAATALEAEYEMAAPTPSLLRIIPFNGESSRRPVPDFLPKKSSTALFHETNIKSSPSRRASQPGHDSSNPFLEKTTGSGGGSGSTGGRIAPPPPPRFNFNFAGAASLAKKRAQSHATQTPHHHHHHHHHHQQAKASPEEVAARRERHPGLYTPSKKKAASAAEQGILSQSTDGKFSIQAATTAATTFHTDYHEPYMYMADR
ncbi:hypothetical protein BGX24_010109 [Mortierella sp. AD032]|nr:hypothetical protein BGX24_010109 [Mortierella sp. AD032]